MVNFVFKGVRLHVTTRSCSESSQSAVQFHSCILLALRGHVAPVCHAATTEDNKGSC